MHGPVVSFPLTFYRHLLLFMRNLYTASSHLSHNPAPLYICLSSSTRNTAWSVHCISTYLSRQYSLYFSLTLIYLILPCLLNFSESLRYS